jgi:hypothetical protein
MILASKWVAVIVRKTPHRNFYSITRFDSEFLLILYLCAHSTNIRLSHRLTLVAWPEGRPLAEMLFPEQIPNKRLNLSLVMILGFCQMQPRLLCQSQFLFHARHFFGDLVSEKRIKSEIKCVNDFFGRCFPRA